MKSMALVIGIDGGGTHTRAVVVDVTLRQYGQAEGPGGNPSAIGWEATAQVLQEVIRSALDSANISASDVAALGIGLAGAPGSRHADRLRAVLEPLLPGAALALSSDLEIALVGAHGRRQGMLLEAGTGSGAWGIGPTGQTVRVGGWGYLIGDEGSGYAIGSAGLRAVMHAYDGRGPATRLTQSLLATLDLPDPDALIRWLYRGGPFQPGTLAALAPLVCDAARDGDPVARQIVVQAAEDLVIQVEATLRALGQESAPLALAGSLLTAPGCFLAEQFTAVLARRLPQVPLVKAQHPPVIGAALLALALVQH